MATLKEILNANGNRPKVISDCERMIDEEVASKGGLSGLAIKGAFMIVKKVKPGFIPEVVDHMLDDFANALDPVYQQAKAKNEPVGPYFTARPGEVADALLGITDARAGKAKNQNIKKAYDGLRPSAKKQVEAAVPRVGRLIEKYTATAA